MKDEEYFRALDALARFYNSEFLVHIGYELTSIAIIVATASITLSPFADVIIYTSKWDRPLVTLAILVVYLIVGISWFLGFPYALHDDSKFPFSFKYLHARSQYYACVSRLVWDHMGMQKWSTPSRVKKLKKRLLGPWGGFRHGLGIIQGILSLFEAELYVSKCKRNGQPLNEIKNNLHKFDVTVDICNPESGDYHSKRESLFWNATDLLILAYRPALYEWLKSGDAVSLAKARLILDP